MTDRPEHLSAEDETHEWLLLVSRGDQSAFSRLLHFYWNKVYVQALTYLHAPPVAQEITQDVFIKIWDNREKLPGLTNFSKYLFIISRNKIIDALRSRTISPTTLPEQFEAIISLPDRQLEFKESWARLMQGIEALPPARKRVFKMSRLDGLSYEEIGFELGISRNGVKDHIVKALNFLRHYMHVQQGDELILLLLAGWAACC